MPKNNIPMDFAGDGADANMDGRTPINAGPDVPAQLATDPNFTASVEREVERRVQSNETEQQAALAAAGADGQRTAALATLGAMIEGNPGDTVEALTFRGAVQDMVLAIHAGGDKPPAEHVAEAMRLNEARVQQLAATSGAGAGDDLADVHAEGQPGYQTFAGAYMGSLFSESNAARRKPGRRESDRVAGNGICIDPARQAGDA